MTIAEKLQTIAENEPKVYEAGREKGYREGYTDATSGTAFETDSSIAYLKIVPSASEKLAQVLKLGGMSYKTTNLIPYPYYSGTQTNNGITFTVNADGTITANGSNNATSLSALLLMLKPLAEGTYTYSFGNIPPDGVYGSVSLYKNGSWVKTLGAFTGSRQQKSFTFTITEEEANYDVGLNYAVTVGYSVSNYTAYPMLNVGSTALPYEPYFEGIRNAKVTEIKSHGKNLFNKDAENYPYSTSNAIIHESSSYKAWFIDVRGLDNITVSINNPDTKGDLQIAIVSDTKLGTIAREAPRGVYRNSPYTTSLKSSNYEANYVCLTMWHTWLDELLPYIQVEAGSETTELVPYVGTIATKPIPEALRNFLEQYGYGLGVNEDYYNYIDYERKKFVQKCKEIDLSSLTFILLSSTEQKVSFRAEIADLYKTSSQTEIPLLLCAQYKTVAQQGTWYVGDISQAHNTNMIYINEAPNTSLEEFTEKIKGVKLVYGLAEPVEIDISAYLTGDNLIEVQGGGTITAVNEYELAAPTTIQFIKKVGA